MQLSRRVLTVALIVATWLGAFPTAGSAQDEAPTLPTPIRLLVAQRDQLLDELAVIDAELVVAPEQAAELAAERRLLDARLSHVEADGAIDVAYADDVFEYPFAVFPVEVVDEFVDSWGSSRSGGRRHKGTDILAPRGVEIYAIEDGFIERTSSSVLGGIGLYLQGDSGARYFYAHLDTLGPQSDGERVRAGEVLGTNGDTGNARGTPHLHLQWAPDGDEHWVNPYPMLIAIWQNERTPFADLLA